MSRHRAEAVRPRWGRLLLVGAAATVTTVALVGGVALGDDDGPATAIDPAGRSSAASTPSPAPAAPAAPASSVPPEVSTRVAAAPDPRRDKTVPVDSGSGYRVVFSQSRQRVWLLDGDDVQRTYLVSGSLTDNLDPGSYAVYSRSEHAVGVDDSGTMDWFVRFTRGENAAIGFHDIPVDDGAPVQTVADLGTPMSHGCVRQEEADAIALWDFAPIGTKVVVTA